MTTDKVKTNFSTELAEMNTIFSDVEISVRNMVWSVDTDDPTFEEMDKTTSEIVENNEFIIGSAVAFVEGFKPDEKYWARYSYQDTVNGEVRSKMMGGDDYDYYSMEWFSYSFANDVGHWCDPYYDDGAGDRLMTTFSLPVHDIDDDGDIVAIITADLSLEWLVDRLDAVKPYEGNYSLLMNDAGFMFGRDITGDGIYFGSVNDEFDEDDELLYVHKVELSLYEKLKEGKYGFSYLNAEGVHLYAMMGKLANDWTFCVLGHYRQVFIKVILFTLGMLLMAIIGLIVLFFITRKIIKRETQPVTEFSYSALNIAKGNFNASIPAVHSDDEIKVLHDSLVYMERSISRYIEELKVTTKANQRFESELQIARNIQMHMLPDVYPDRDDLDLHATVMPAREVGGDLYDFAVVGDKLFFSVGDVSGKGVPAALYMSITRSAFRFMSGMGLGLAGVISHINHSLCDGNKEDMFVTMFAGKLDLLTGELEWCNCGHNPIVVMSPGSKPYFLKTKSNLALGLIDGFNYEAERITFPKGTRLLIYTDGVTEAENSNQELFGEERLMEWAASLMPSSSSVGAIESLLLNLKQFTGDNEQNDDITVMSVYMK